MIRNVVPREKKNAEFPAFLERNRASILIIVSSEI